MDTNQTANQSSVQQPSSSGGSASQVVQPAPQSQVQPAPSATPRGKEAAPVAVQQGEVGEYTAPSAHESVPEVPLEVERAGVSISPQPQQVKLTPEQQAAGIKPSGDAVVMQSQQAVPQWTIDEIEKKASGPADDSGTWLNKLKLFVLGQRRQR